MEGKNKMVWACYLALRKRSACGGSLGFGVSTLSPTGWGPSWLLPKHRRVCDGVSKCRRPSPFMIGHLGRLWGSKFPPWTDYAAKRGNRWSFWPRRKSTPRQVEQRVQWPAWGKQSARSRYRRQALCGLRTRGVLRLLLADIRIAFCRKFRSAFDAAERSRARNRIPLDSWYAADLGITREQVIHQRQSARRRLARRMRAFS